MDKEIGQKQLAELIASVTRALPQDINSDVAQGWIDNPSALKKVLRTTLLPPKNMDGEQATKLFPCQIHCPELIPDWMKSVVEDVEPTVDLDISKIQFKSFLESGEDCVYGDDVRTRAVAMKGVLGLADVEKFLAEPDKIPVSLRDKYIVFSGTVLLDSVGARHVAYLFFREGRWVLGFKSLGHGLWCDGIVLPVNE